MFNRICRYIGISKIERRSRANPRPSDWIESCDYHRVEKNDRLEMKVEKNDRLEKKVATNELLVEFPILVISVSRSG